MGRLKNVFSVNSALFHPPKTQIKGKNGKLFAYEKRIERNAKKGEKKKHIKLITKRL